MSNERRVEQTRLANAGGPELEARWDRPPEPRAVAVFCHPHPQQGGTMLAPLMHKVTKQLVAAGVAVLRFNFRGVGQSGGDWGEGIEEIDDVGVAARHAGTTHPGLPAGLAGWSFGAATALRWQARERNTWPYAGIAPPVRSDLTPRLPPAAELPPATRRFILGDRDQFIDVEELRAYADSAQADLVVLKGSDHFFHFREDTVGDLVAEALSPDPIR